MLNSFIFVQKKQQIYVWDLRSFPKRYPSKCVDDRFKVFARHFVTHFSAIITKLFTPQNTLGALRYFSKFVWKIREKVIAICVL